MKTKILRRVYDFATGSLYGFLPVMFQMILSWIVVNRSGLVTWGGFMEFSIWVNAAVAIAGWGVKDFLLKKFSEQPSSVHQIWNVHVASRSVLVFILIPFFFLFKFNIHIEIGMAAWFVMMTIGKYFDPIVFYQKSAGKILWVEPFLYIISGCFLWFNPLIISRENLLFMMVFIYATKFICLAILYRNWLQLSFLKFQHAYWVESLPYFLPVVAGYLYWKVDTLVGTYFLSKVELGRYTLLQGVLNFYPGLFAGGLSVFQKNYNRLSENAIHMFNKQSMLVGVVGSIIYSGAGYWFLNYAYGLDFQISVLGLSILQLVPFVLYYPIILKLIKYHRQSDVAWVTTGLALLGLMICVALAQQSTFMGVFLAFVMFQWVALVVFFLVGKKV